MTFSAIPSVSSSRGQTGDTMGRARNSGMPSRPPDSWPHKRLGHATMPLKERLRRPCENALRACEHTGAGRPWACPRGERGRS
jgi:hypothetical protein